MSLKLHAEHLMPGKKGKIAFFEDIKYTESGILFIYKALSVKR